MQVLPHLRLQIFVDFIKLHQTQFVVSVVLFLRIPLDLVHVYSSHLRHFLQLAIGRIAVGFSLEGSRVLEGVVADEVSTQAFVGFLVFHVRELHFEEGPSLTQVGQRSFFGGKVQVDGRLLVVVRRKSNILFFGHLFILSWLWCVPRDRSLHLVFNFLDVGKVRSLCFLHL